MKARPITARLARGVVTLAGALAILWPGAASAGQGGQAPCCGGGTEVQRPGMMTRGDPDHMADMQLFRELIANRDKIRRTVTVRSDGVETVTEFDDPAVAAQIRAHVAAMYTRVAEGRPIHQRDPLFRAVFGSFIQCIAMTNNAVATR